MYCMTYDDTDNMSWQVNPLTAWQWQYIQINRQQVTKFQLPVVKSTWIIKLTVSKIIPNHLCQLLLPSLNQAHAEH